MKNNLTSIGEGGEVVDAAKFKEGRDIIIVSKK